VCYFPYDFISIPTYGFKINKQLQDYDTRIKLLYGTSLRLHPSIMLSYHEFFIIATPERMSNPEFMKLLDVVYDNHNLNRLIVDEVRVSPIYFYLLTLTPFFIGTLYFCKDVFPRQPACALSEHYLGMGSQFPRRLSTIGEVPGEIPRCSHYGFDSHCYANVRLLLLLTCLALTLFAIEFNEILSRV